MKGERPSIIPAFSDTANAVTQSVKLGGFCTNPRFFCDATDIFSQSKNSLHINSLQSTSIVVLRLKTLYHPADI